MTRVLLLSIRFLDSCYHGLTDSGERPEWPPSPFRVFQALVAGSAETTLPGSIADDALPCRHQRDTRPGTIATIRDPLFAALQWLESLDAPHIIAPQAWAGRVLLSYVLNNMSDSNTNSRTPKMIRPTVLNGDRLLQYVWTFEDTMACATKHAQIIVKAASHIRCLGWGIDLAVGCGEVIEIMPQVTAPRILYRPTDHAATSGVDLRTPTRGSILSLERGYADSLRRYELSGVTKLESAGAIYEPRLYVVGASRPNVTFRLVNENGDTVSVRHQLIKPLVGMIRDLSNRSHVVASVGQDTIDREIKGHPKDSSSERVSILPLPTVRDGPTDGRIRCVMLAQPFESKGVLCAALGQLFNGQRLTPVSGESRFPPIYLERIDERAKAPVLPRYTGISRIWASVTPVLLPGYDDRKQHHGDHKKRLVRAEQLVRKALTQAGIDSVVAVELSRVPYWPGALHAQSYQPRDKLSSYPRWHVRLTFNQPFTGPLAIGAGRHCGFGLFAAAESS